MCEKRRKKHRKNKEILTKFCWFVSQEWLEGSYSNFKCALPCMKANSTVNLVPFGLDIKELWIRENRYFVVPVNILTLFVRPPFSWAAWAPPVFLGRMTHYRVNDSLSKCNKFTILFCCCRSIFLSFCGGCCGHSSTPLFSWGCFCDRGQ